MSPHVSEFDPRFLTAPFPTGKLEVYGQGTNTADPAAEVAERNHKLNTPEKLRAILHDQNILSTWKLPTTHGLYRHSIIRPTAPYTPHGLMLVVFPEGQYEAMSRETQFVYAYPEAVQRRYWQMILAGLEAYHNCQPHQPLFVENVTLTSNAHRTSRTLNPVHGQFVVFDEALFSPKTGEIDHLVKESRATASLVRRVFRNERLPEKDSPITTLIQNMPSLQTLGITTHLYTTPAGYGFSFPLNQSTPEHIQTVMTEHWRAYAAHCQEEQEKAVRAEQKSNGSVRLKKIIPGPSYRQYVWIESNIAQIVICPEYTSHAGVLEALGVELHRSTEGHRVADDQRDVQEARFVACFSKLLNREQAPTER